MDHSETFILALAKTEQGKLLMDEIHDKLYCDNNETKTNFSDINMIQSLLFIIYNEKQYYNHINMLKIPTRIRKQCSIAQDINLCECIYFMQKMDDPENKDKDLIHEMSYNDIKILVKTINNHIKYQNSNN
jgi:uncharacterized LabA/DUF88 family protein